MRILGGIALVNTRFDTDSRRPFEYIPLCVPEIRGNEWRYIKECLDTGWVSSVGNFVDRFESELAKRVGAKFAVATVNGTAAIHIALLVSGVEPNDEVLVSTLTFIAPVNAIRYSGAWPVFIDAEWDYWQMDPQKVVEFLEKCCEWKHGELRNRSSGRRVKAILPVDILGHPVDMDPIRAVADKYNLVIIEDATESLGAKYKNRSAGTLGDIGCFSFNGNKIITTGGGGMIVTDNEEWAKRARYLTTQAKDDPVEFIHGEIGYNYRLTNIQAAMGCAQLELLDEYIAAKRRIAATMTRELSGIPGVCPMRQARWAESIYWLYTILLDSESCSVDSRTMLKMLGDKGIQTRPLWMPVHRNSVYSGMRDAQCPIAEKLNRNALSVPCSVGITDAEMQKVIASLKHCCSVS